MYISEIIARFGLENGQQMKNVHGEDIENSVIINRYTVIYREDFGMADYRMIVENPITGEETNHSFTDESFEIIKNISF